MQVISRQQWGARAPRSRSVGSLTRESTGHWNGPNVPVGSHDRCASLVRGIQSFHMDGRGWNDIAYNFLVCQHGYVFEGRGLNVINAANGTNEGNRVSHGIMWIAGENNAFTDEEKVGFSECVRYVANAVGAPDAAIGHRQWRSTACPGDARYNWIHQGMPVPNSPTSPTPTPNPVVDNQPTLQLGSRGDAVRQVQMIIRDHAGGDIAVDGIFGPHTKKRVSDLQAFFGLVADGVVGSKTWAILNYISSVKPSQFGDWPHLKKPTIRQGAKGNGVKYLQNVILAKAGGNITVDGIFGQQTENRIRELQAFFGMTVDGIVGPNTWAVIDFMATH